MQEVGEVQILVVDDGSEPAETHATRAIIESLRPNYPLLQPLLELPNNIGKGGAVYAGVSGEALAWRVCREGLRPDFWPWSPRDYAALAAAWD